MDLNKIKLNEKNRKKVFVLETNYVRTNLNPVIFNC